MSVLVCVGCGDREDRPLCNLYSVTKGQQAIRELAGAMHDRTGNFAAALRHLPELLRPDRPQPAEGRELDDGAVGHASPVFCAEGQEIRSGRHQCP